VIVILIKQTGFLKINSPGNPYGGVRIIVESIDRNEKLINEPIDKFNHGIDAVRYVCLAKVMVNRKRMVKVGRV